MTPARENNRFDILRLLAAWLVLFSHCFPLGGRPASEPMVRTVGIDTLGGVGVAIFFVLSGYLITQSLERSPDLLVFARRRAVRIYPGLVVVCLLCVLVLGPWMTTETASAYWRSDSTWKYLSNATGCLIRFPLPGVFADNPAPGAINGSLWSLPYEIQCYVALALLSRLPGSLRVKVTAVFAALLVVMVVRPASPPASPFATFLRLDHYDTKLGLLFALGSLYSCWRDRLRPLPWPALAGLVAALALAHRVPSQTLFLLSLGTLALWLALHGRWLPRVPERLGDWSYGAYLYGFPVQQVLAHHRLHQVSFAGYIVACTVVTFALAGLSWHLVEKPALRWK